MRIQIKVQGDWVTLTFPNGGESVFNFNDGVDHWEYVTGFTSDKLWAFLEDVQWEGEGEDMICTLECDDLRRKSPTPEIIEAEFCVDCVGIIGAGEDWSEDARHSLRMELHLEGMGEWVPFIDCEESYFSWRMCDGCGCTKGGDRSSGGFVKIPSQS